MAKTIAALLHGRDNNFNLVRFLAASAVLLDHSFALVRPDIAATAFVDFAKLEIGRLAVDVFFIVSGFLVTRSVLTQPTLVDYAVARFLRLFPALVVATIGIAFVLGPLVTSVPWQDYFSDPRPWLYVPLTASLITHSLTLPGVFETVPVSGVIDAPLWTLRYETMCYVLLAIFAVLGMLATKTRAGLTLALILAVYIVITFATPLRGEIAAVDSATRFVFGFFVGGALYLFADKLKLSLAIALLLGIMAAATYSTPVYELALRVALGYGLIWFALVPAGAIRNFNRVGDYSYGLYILCFPIQQTIVMLEPAVTPWALFISSFPAVLGLAVLSWHFVEHSALSRKAWAGDCVGSLLSGVRERLAASFGQAAATKALK
jgi:peptidoglycan/LPS O-acetylase OafA/YrhL